MFEAILAVVGLVAVAGLFVLLQKQRQAREAKPAVRTSVAVSAAQPVVAPVVEPEFSTRAVVSMREAGPVNLEGESWGEDPDATTVPHAGFRKLEEHVRRLHESPSEFTSLVVSSLDGKKSVLLSKMHGQLRMLVNVSGGLGQESAQALARQAADGGEDTMLASAVAPHPEIEGGLVGGVESTVDLVARVLTEIYGLDPDAGLRYSFFEA